LQEIACGNELWADNTFSGNDQYFYPSKYSEEIDKRELIREFEYFLKKKLWF